MVAVSVTQGNLGKDIDDESERESKETDTPSPALTNPPLVSALEKHQL